jgi:hypothetical protein
VVCSCQAQDVDFIPKDERWERILAGTREPVQETREGQLLGESQALAHARD